MFRVKICGVTTTDDAAGAVAAGADAIGLNFYSRSSRHVTFERAGEIASAVAGAAQIVGVFVNSYAISIERAVDAAQLTCVQLHGDETPETLVTIKAPRIIRAFRCGPDWLPKACEYLSRCRELGRIPDGVLLDAAGSAGAYGGTGTNLDWTEVSRWRADMDVAAQVSLPLLLAGGLLPSNVAEAIALARPDGVDVASGVEAQPGVKDPQKVRSFVAQALASLANLSRD